MHGKWISVVLAMGLAGALLPLPARCATHQQRGAPAAHHLPPPEARVDINRASVEELMKVPGMTRTWAVRIERFRPYKAKSDLLDRGVLPSGVYDRIRDYVIAHRAKK